MRINVFGYFVLLLLCIAFPFSGFAQNDSICIHSKGKIMLKESLEKIDSITFSDSHIPPVFPERGNKVLLLKVGYTTSFFENGIELLFNVRVDTLPIAREFDPPSDFGSLKFYYPEINKQLFYGTIVWMGTGKIEYPDPYDWLPRKEFAEYVTGEAISPKNGFENIFDVYKGELDYSKAWESVRNLVKVQEYLKLNPEQKVKFFLYGPTEGLFDPAVAKWIFILIN